MVRNRWSVGGGRKAVGALARGDEVEGLGKVVVGSQWLVVERLFVNVNVSAPKALGLG